MFSAAKTEVMNSAERRGGERPAEPDQQHSDDAAAADIRLAVRDQPQTGSWRASRQRQRDAWPRASVAQAFDAERFVGKNRSTASSRSLSGSASSPGPAAGSAPTRWSSTGCM